MLLRLLPALCLLAITQGVERHFNLTVAMRLAMEYGENCDYLGQHCEPNYLGYVKGDKLFYHNASANTGDPGVELPVPADSGMLVLDGNYRAVTAVNGQVPGPAIEVDEGDVVVVRLTNKLDNAATTLHFHGMYQRGTPWMDGVSQITQCAVLPQETFTYRFIAEPAGTHFWHAHHGVQRPAGIFGALIVRPKTPQHKCDIQEADTMILSVWQHMDSESLFVKRDGPGWFPNGPEQAPWKWSRDVSGKLVGEIPMASGLINGRGRFNGNSVNLTVFEAKPGVPHCFRVVASQEGKALRLSVDSHQMQVLASDGHPIEPVSVQSVIIFPGETFDVQVSPTAGVSTTSKNFWVRADTLEVGLNHSLVAILRYPGAAESDPDSGRTICSAQRRCGVLNCPFPSYHPLDYTDCIQMDQARDAAPSPVPATKGLNQTWLNFAFEPSINNRRFAAGSAPPLTQRSEAGMKECDPDVCDKSPFPSQPCECTHYATVPHNYTVQLILTNLGVGGFGMHPVHLHGHDFRVLKIGFPPVFPDTGAVCKWPAGDAHPTCKQTEDIICEDGTGCAVARWNGTAPVLNRDRPPVKNTVVVPPGGYTVVEFESNNPGWWHLHCHMAHHLQSGMGMILNEAPEMQAQFPAPPGFPRCGSLDDTSELAAHVAQARSKWEQMQ
eukprot:TRINITY_DN19840_c0_g1_i2.p1 TRINITY_DN19840_c0_g1~~TRINITY_DN19840_c0_g1_i2.p1  ORF type:complete len:666 (-),score=126.12 TRINITY_DN19840_c0_g1_i2:189-2186(-)